MLTMAQNQVSEKYLEKIQKIMQENPRFYAKLAKL